MDSSPHLLYTDRMTVGSSTTINLSSSFKSDPRKLESTPGYAIQFSWSGASTPVGTFSLEASNDNSVYTTINESTVAVSGASDSIMINVERPAYLYVRVSYTRTSGSGGSVLILINGVE